MWRLAFALILFVSPSVALADAIHRTRELECHDVPVCSRGAVPMSNSHSSCPSHCGPMIPCTSAEACASWGPGSTCEPTSFCIARVASGNSEGEVVFGACVDNACSAASIAMAAEAGAADVPACVEVSRCVMPPPPPVSSACGGCSARTGRRSAPWVVGALLLSVAVRSRRRPFGARLRSPRRSESQT